MKIFKHIAPAIALFLASAAGLVLEIVAARLIAPYVGMSLYTWTAIIATVLGGMSAGHWLGGRLSETADRIALARLAVLFAAAAVNVLCIPALLWWTAPGLLSRAGGDVAGQILAVAQLSLVLFFLPSLLIAASSPILTRIAIDAAPDRRGVILGRMFAAGALGAILGTVATGFVFISWIGSQGTLIAVSGALGILALASATVVRTKPLIALTVFVFLSGLAAANQMRDAFFAKVCTVESDFFCIRIVDYTGMAARESRLMILDHMGHGINDRDDPALLHSSYVDLTDRVADLRFGGRDAIRTYFIGGGAYTLPRAWASKYPAGEHWVAELDPAVTRVAAERMWVNFGPSIRPVHRDARALLQSLSTEKRFDVIIGDAFRDIAIPHHLVTLEFNREIEARLAPNGFYALTVIDGWRDPKFLFAMVKTLREAFPVVEIWADADMMATSGRLTYLLLAGREPFAASELRSARFPERRWIRVSARSIPGRLSMDDVPVLTDDFAPVDRLIGAVASRSR